MNNSYNSLDWKKLPWGIFLFLLAVFVFATPFDFSWPIKVLEGTDEVDAAEAIMRMEKGNIGRRIALFLLGVFAVMSLLRRNRNRFGINGLLGWLILFYLIWAIFSTVWSNDMVFTIRRVVILILLSLGALAVAERFSLRDIAALAFFIFAATLLAAIFTEVRANTFQPFNESWRFTGVMHPIPMGWNCGLLALAALALAKADRKGRSLYWWGIALIAMIFLLLTKSRMATAAAFIGLCVYWLLVSSKIHKVTLIFGVVILGCLLYLSLGEKLNTYGEIATTLGRGDEVKETVSTLTGRIPLWRECLKYAAERPILGYGYNSFLGPHNFSKVSQAVGWAPDSTHSGYIDALMGLGFIGASLFVSILFLYVKTSMNLSRQNPQYAFVAAVSVWLCLNLLLETDLITRPYFSYFISLIMMAKLGFFPRNRSVTNS